MAWSERADTLNKLADVADKLKSEETKPIHDYTITNDEIRSWSGDLDDKKINGVLNTLFEEGDISDSLFQVKKGESVEKFNDDAHARVKELMGEVREGMWPDYVTKEEIKDVIWAAIMENS